MASFKKYWMADARMQLPRLLDAGVTQLTVSDPLVADGVERREILAERRVVDVHGQVALADHGAPVGL